MKIPNFKALALTVAFTLSSTAAVAGKDHSAEIAEIREKAETCHINEAGTKLDILDENGEVLITFERDTPEEGFHNKLGLSPDLGRYSNSCKIVKLDSTGAFSAKKDESFFPEPNR